MSSASVSKNFYPQKYLRVYISFNDVFTKEFQLLGGIESNKMETFLKKMIVVYSEILLLHFSGWSEETIRNLIRNTPDLGRDLNPKYLMFATRHKS
jgi:hypothetical protein